MINLRFTCANERQNLIAEKFVKTNHVHDRGLMRKHDDPISLKKKKRSKHKAHRRFCTKISFEKFSSDEIKKYFLGFLILSGDFYQYLHNGDMTIVLDYSNS